MARLVLFSIPNEEVMAKIHDDIFPKNKTIKEIAFIPSEGMSKYKQKYREFWEAEAKENNYTLKYIDFENFNITNVKEILDSVEYYL